MLFLLLGVVVAMISCQDDSALGLYDVVKKKKSELLLGESRLISVPPNHLFRHSSSQR